MATLLDAYLARDAGNIELVALIIFDGFFIYYCIKNLPVLYRLRREEKQKPPIPISEPAPLPEVSAPVVYTPVEKKVEEAPAKKFVTLLDDKRSKNLGKKNRKILKNKFFHFFLFLSYSDHVTIEIQESYV